MTFYRDKRVVVTGGAGFLGSHLVDALLARGARVLVVDDLSHGHYLRPGVEFLKIDARHTSSLVHALYGANYVFNLAATVAGVQYNQTHQREMHDDNAMLQSAIVAAIQEIEDYSSFFAIPLLQVSSVCVYAPQYNSPCLELNGYEGEPTAANAGYAHAKRIGETLAIANLRHVVIVRPSNLYGPRDYYHPREQAHVIPAIIDKVMNDDEVVVNGTGNERREFLYVEDAAQGMLYAMEHGHHREAYNLGTNGSTVISIRGLVDKIQVYAGTNKPVRFTQQFDAGDNARWSNCEKLMTLGWQSTTGLDEGIKRAIADYRDRDEGTRVGFYACVECGV